MALYADGIGKFQKEFDELWNNLVPHEGNADSLQGELIRIIGRLASEFYRNGNMNWETNPYYQKMANCLQTELCKYFTDDFDNEAISCYMYQIIQNGITGVTMYVDGEDQYDKITDYVVIFCQRNKELIKNNCPERYDY